MSGTGCCLVFVHGACLSLVGAVNVPPCRIPVAANWTHPTLSFPVISVAACPLRKRDSQAFQAGVFWSMPKEETNSTSLIILSTILLSKPAKTVSCQLNTTYGAQPVPVSLRDEKGSRGVMHTHATHTHLTHTQITEEQTW